MTEERIFELLIKKFSNTSITPQSKYKFEIVKNISQTISELIYNVINSETITNVEKRTNLIVSLFVLIYST